MKIEIEKLAFGGAGIGRVEGKVVFVKGGLPGDNLKVRITREKGSYAEAEIVGILSPSPGRTTPPCPVFGKCGGCQWQHLNYSYQLKAKESIFRETLERIGGLKDLEIEPISASPEEYGYRNRIILSVWFREGRYRVGYHEEGSRRLVEIEGCPIASKPVDEAIGNLTRSLFSMSKPHFSLKKIHVTSDNNSAFMTLVPDLRDRPNKLRPFRQHLNEFSGTENIGIAGENEKEFQITLLGLVFYSVPSVFIQVNKEINEQIIATLIEYADLEGQERVLDLYCGIGSFSLHLAKRAKEVIGADVNAKAIELARKSAEINSIENVFFDATPSELFVEESLRRRDKFDLIVIDPPREGVKAILKKLSGLSPKKIIYVSCNPPTLARDLKTLKEFGYRIVRTRPFDMFPQTFHIESIALLHKI